jgi:hypothetical protein
MRIRFRNAIKSAVCALALAGCVGFPAIARADTNDAAASVTNQPTGPTLRLDYNRDAPGENLLADFMYFVPLISTEPVMVTESTNGIQHARVTSFVRKDRGKSFQVICEFEFTGAGYQRNVIDQTGHIQRREQQLKSGKPMVRLLESIDVTGPGKGMIEVEGMLVVGKPVVNEVRFVFNAHSQPSPVNIALEDIHYADGKMVPTNEVVARVNTLKFERKPGPSKMEVTIASVKAKGAPDTFWQNFKGGLKGGLANLFIPPLTVTALGHETMLEFGAALGSQSPVFSFPLATNVLTMPGKP